MQRFFTKGTNKLSYDGPQSEIDKLLNDGWTEVANLNLSLSELKSSAKIGIDMSAGQARARKVSKGEMVDQEYMRAYEDSIEYKNSGYSGAAPSSVQAWASAKGWTAQQAADDIIATRNGWMSILDSIRNSRLSGKANVDAATTETAVISERDAAISALNAL